MGESETNGRTVKSGQTLLAVIEALKELDGASVSELAAELDIAKSTAHRHVTTLAENGYVDQIDDTYTLSFRFLDLGGYVRDQHRLYKQIRPSLERLSEETGELATFIVEDDGMGVFVYRELGSNGVNTAARVGSHTYLHQTAAGKAILAEFSEERFEEILDRHGLPRKTAHTITDDAELREEIEEIRRRGYAYAAEENTKGLTSVGAAVYGPNDALLGAVSIDGPSHRLQGEWLNDEIPQVLLSAINEYELNVSYL
ncbi:IclR family transcriptional regulator [Natrinema halophilum]|uniref:IclR family transcriptional regulator n=1 Tax=Natrinema halophilum TaxID=1699371 RepID=A0A7D5H3N9_9EURY|nr:IclR family transcriptional regulator [Natrinema halophilum]QLG49991.1 IclR family transcriptional regulator [Natrinema halophilum]